MWCFAHPFIPAYRTGRPSRQAGEINNAPALQTPPIPLFSKEGDGGSYYGNPLLIAVQFAQSFVLINTPASVPA
jgi:hypothetical protein